MSGDQRPPRIAACFLIRFDSKIGYTLTWRRSIPGLELEGSVEYSSLPSGLHKTKQDLVYAMNYQLHAQFNAEELTHSGTSYYIYNQFTGVSAFLQEPGNELERNARFLAIGILIPCQDGWLGRAWLHATQLQELAKEVLQDTGETSKLERYWETYRTVDATDSTEAPGSLNELKLEAPQTPDQDITSQHPVLSSLNLLDSFGPLIFPIYRVILLRQRLLLLKEPPVRVCCEYVYILALIASIPPRLVDTSLKDSTLSNVTALFNISIRDIPMLENINAAQANLNRVTTSQPPDCHTVEVNKSAGWIACSSDEVLFTKPSLSDIRIKISADGTKQWPTIYTSDGRLVKATRRDLRRYKTLRQGIRSIQQHLDGAEDSDAAQHHALSSASFGKEPWATKIDVAAQPSIVEEPSWAAMAYDSYMWWASAGERSADLQDEFDHDAELLSAEEERGNTFASHHRRHGGQNLPLSTDRVTMALISYFHGWTASIMESLKRLVEDSRGLNNTCDKYVVLVSKDDLICMGLDPWSQNDRLWVVDMIKIYFDLDADVQAPNLECCGVKVC